MSTTTNTTDKTSENKQTVKAEWQANKLQTEVLKSVATLYNSLETILSEQNAQVIAEVNKTILINKNYYASLPIDSPTDLAKAVAEYTTNVLGIKVTTVTTPTKATIVFEGGSLANKLATINKLQEEAVEKLIAAYKNGLADLGAIYGYVTEATNAQADFIVTFSKEK
jgi:ethanolamine ammonia-lyase large subunit